MADIKRKANAEWTGDLRGGKGRMDTASGALKEIAYGFSTRFEDAPGTNPEELLAAAHAGCFSMAFSATLGRKGFTPESIQTTATCIMTKEEAGFRISKMVLETVGRVPGIDEATFKEIAAEAEKGCPVSTLLRPGLEVELHAKLV